MSTALEEFSNEDEGFRSCGKRIATVQIRSDLLHFCEERLVFFIESSSGWYERLLDDALEDEEYDPRNGNDYDFEDWTDQASPAQY